MNYLGIDLNMKNIPKYDKGFLPFARFLEAYKASVKACGGVPLKIALERENGQIHYHIEIPFDAQAAFIPEKADTALTVNGVETSGEQVLTAGVYDIYCSEQDVATEYFKLK